MKMALRNTMRLGAKGIKISCSGRLAGAEIAKTEHYHEGTIPLQTIRADIEYGFWEADTTYGKIGVKVWIYRGEVLSEVNRTSTNAPRDNKDRKNFRRDNRNGERRGNNRNDRTPREGGRRNVNA
jgi:small subunit ribosomal protein S3